MSVESLPFADWESFYVIVGSSAGALTGLQFVVITLGAEARSLGDERQVDAFGTPQVVHFGAALLVSAILSAPWQRLGSAAAVIGACALAGFVYTLIVTRRATRQTGYKPVLEDWVWHSILPLVAYAGMLVSAGFLHWRSEPSLFGVAAASLLLLFIGIHNAWDTVTFLALQRGRRPEQKDRHD